VCDRWRRAHGEDGVDASFPKRRTPAVVDGRREGETNLADDLRPHMHCRQRVLPGGERRRAGRESGTAGNCTCEAFIRGSIPGRQPRRNRPSGNPVKWHRFCDN
jgi:hypothetical protein